MPGEDHAVHELVKKHADARYGCHNRPSFSVGYWARDTVLGPLGRLRTVQKWIIHRMSNECRYDMSLKDSSCTNCKHRGSGEEYARRIREIGT